MTKVVIKTTNELYTVELEGSKEEVLDGLLATFNTVKFIFMGTDLIIPVSTITEVRAIDNKQHEVVIEEDTEEHDVVIEE